MPHLWTKKQWEYIRAVEDNPLKYNFQWGSTGSGKTNADIRYLIPKLLINKKELSGLNIIGGVSEGTIKRNIIEPLIEFWGEKFVSPVVTGNVSKIFGEKVYILGTEKINQLTKFQGSTVKTIFCDEIAKWHPEVFNYLHTRLRAPHSQLLATFNPEHPKHFIHQFLANDIQKNVVHSTVYDNSFLTDQTIADLEQAYPKGSVYHTRYILGLPCQAEGLIYREFADNVDKFLIKKSDLPQNMYVSIGIDFGKSESENAMVAEGIREGSLYVLKSRSVSAKNKTFSQVEADIDNFIMEVKSDYQNQTIDMFMDSAEPTYINTFSAKWRNKGVHVYGSVKNPINDRIRATIILMSSGRFFIVEGQNDDLIEGLSEAVWDSDAVEDVRLDDGTSNIDILDAFEYGFEYNLWNLIG